MTKGASNIDPILHEPSILLSALGSGDLGSEILLETIAALANKEMWRQLWTVADSLSREVSVLFDRDGRIWVDIGTAGQVRLSPPVGSSIPFSLWIHTHPWDAYWSPTDLGTLAAYSRIMCFGDSRDMGWGCAAAPVVSSAGFTVRAWLTVAERCGGGRRAVRRWTLCVIRS